MSSASRLLQTAKSPGNQVAGAFLKMAEEVPAAITSNQF